MAAATLTRDEFVREVVRQDAAKYDILADTRRMSAAVEDGAVVLGIDTAEQVESVALNDLALGQMGTALDIPAKYLRRMLKDAPGLLGTNLNHWLANEPNKRIIRTFRSEDGGAHTGRAYLSNGYRRLDNIEIVRRLFPIFDAIGGVQFQQAAITDTTLHLHVILPKFEAAVKVGDIVQMGLAIKNSEVGGSRLTLEPRLLRLICTNGMTVRDTSLGFAARHVGRRIENEDQFRADTLAADDEAFWLQVRDTAESMLTGLRFQEIVERLQAVANSDTIQAPIAATEVLKQRYSLSEDEREAVLRNLVMDGDLTQWGMLNAVTATAKGVGSFDRRDELEALGWEIAGLSPKEWASVAVAAE